MQAGSASFDLQDCEWSESEDGWESCEWSEDDFEVDAGSTASLLQDCEWSSDEDQGFPDNTSHGNGAYSCKTRSIGRCAGTDTKNIDERNGIATSLPHVRRSPRTPKPKKRPDDFGSARKLSFATEEHWKLSCVMQMEGCSERCTAKVHGLTEHDVLIAHDAFWCKTYTQQRQWLLDYFLNHCPKNEAGEKDPRSMPFLLSGRVVCQAVWLSVLSVSNTRFYEMRKEFVEGRACIEEGKRSRSLSSKSLEAIAWMKSYFERVGDKRPDKNGMYLPTCLTEKAIYERMAEELYGGDSSQGVSFSQFNRLFRYHFPNVTIPKHCRFTKCNFCTLIKNELEKPTTSKDEKEKLHKLQKEHLNLQVQERQRYYTNRQLAMEGPCDYLSIIVDGMDQNKTNVPHLIRVPKSCQNLWCLRTHLTGCLVHGIGNFGFFDFMQYPHDCNLTVTSLLHTLYEVGKKAPLPRYLRLQMDNCVRENKNKYVLGFLALLVQKRIFLEIELGFLMVGHTHEDIDQSFSCLSRFLQKHNAFTYQDMESRFQESNRSVVGAMSLRHVFDIRKWISPFLKEIHNHTQPHIFRFKRTAQDTTEMHYKHWSHESWMPSGEGLVLLKGTPDCIPQLVVPSLDKIDLHRLKNDIPKYSQSGAFPESATVWWQEFLDNFESNYVSTPEHTPPWILDQLNSQGTRQQPVLQVPIKITEMHEKETKQIKEVQLGKRQKPHATDHHSKKCKDATSSETPAPTLHVEAPKPSIGVTKVGEFVALRLVKYDDEIPQIAKVVEMDDSDVTVEWWMGSFNDNWREWKEKKAVVKEKFPRNAVIKSGITFTASKRLPTSTVKELKSLYQLVELI